MRAVDFDAVRELCLRRDVDLVVASPPLPYLVRLQGQYDDYGDYFSFLMTDVEYINLAGRLTVGDLWLVSDFNSLPNLVPAWAELRRLYSGPALVIRDADSASWSDISPESLFLAIANRIDCVAGADWDKVARR